MEILWDWRLIVSIVVVLLAGITKGISGMGLPLVATPVLTLLYNLPTAMAISSIPAVLTDLQLMYTFRSRWREALGNLPLFLLAIVGTVIGVTRILAMVDERYLAMALGLILLIFVTVSWFELLPKIKPGAAKILGPIAGFLGGALQGATGAAGPIIAMYLYNLPLLRPSYLFMINSIFLMIDSTQAVALYRLGYFSPTVLWASLGASVLAMGMLTIVLVTQYDMNEQVFRRAVLVVIGLTGVSLFVKGFV